MRERLTVGQLGLRADARRLRDQYGHLLRPEPAFDNPAGDRAVDALERARQRLTQAAPTAPAEPPSQMTLDIGGR